MIKGSRRGAWRASAGNRNSQPGDSLNHGLLGTTTCRSGDTRPSDAPGTAVTCLLQSVSPLSAKSSLRGARRPSVRSSTVGCPRESRWTCLSLAPGTFLIFKAPCKCSLTALFPVRLQTGVISPPLTVVEAKAEASDLPEVLEGAGDRERRRTGRGFPTGLWAHTSERAHTRPPRSPFTAEIWPHGTGALGVCRGGACSAAAASVVGLMVSSRKTRCRLWVVEVRPRLGSLW